MAVFREIFSGHHLTAPLVLTGFAGAFLAFSGLESISQLSPVMRAPRHKTVTIALAFVVITVGITSPLLTIFSTTLLNAAKVDPNKFISQLGGAYGGEVLKLATAVTASALLVFASNTAIIGAYHVFVALSRMRFFPEIVERRNKLRDTPHVSIALATFIPLGVLVAVHGQIQILGDMYAFGLLGAFSLTCLALDVIRYRERHGMAHVGAIEEAGAHAMSGSPGEPHGGSVEERPVRALLGVFAARWASEHQLARLRAAWAATLGAWDQVSAVVRPAQQKLSRRWPDVKYVLGFLTTALVSLAWLTNLKTKPLATEFGGGLTILGVGIAIAHFKYQQAQGESPVHLPMSLLHPIPGSVLVFLAVGDIHNRAVMQAAVDGANGRPLVFLCLGSRPRQPVELLAFADPYLSDRAAQRILSRARTLADRAKVPAYFVYRVDGAQSVANVWRIIQPEELMATAEVARMYGHDIAPEYVRRVFYHELVIEHRVRKHRAAVDDSMGGALPKMPIAPPASPTPTMPNTEPENRLAGPPPRERRPTIPRLNGHPPERPRHAASGSQGNQTPTSDDEWVWTGTDLVRRPPTAQEPDDER